MAVRSDITVNFASSPRIVMVVAPSTEVNLQDLYDTLRDIEASEQGILYPMLLNAAGKQVLGGGALVGMTLTLRNALLSFEARTGPTWVLCQVSGGNLVAVDAGGAPLPSPLCPTAYTYAVATQSTSASLLSGTGGLTKDDVKTAVWVESPIGAQVAADAEDARQKLLNDEDLAADGTVTTFDDGGAVPLFRQFVTDVNGGPIAVPASAPARRRRTL